NCSRSISACSCGAGCGCATRRCGRSFRGGWGTVDDSPRLTVKPKRCELKADQQGWGYGESLSQAGIHPPPEPGCSRGRGGAAAGDYLAGPRSRLKQRLQFRQLLVDQPAVIILFGE